MCLQNCDMGETEQEVMDEDALCELVVFLQDYNDDLIEELGRHIKLNARNVRILANVPPDALAVAHDAILVEDGEDMLRRAYDTEGIQDADSGAQDIELT